jgi:hypothetical protein
MTTTAFKIDLMVPCMGMKRFTSHSNTPTTIRATRICMRGILFVPFLLCRETLPDWFLELPCALDGAHSSMNPFDSTNDWTDSPARVLDYVVVRDPCCLWMPRGTSSGDGLADKTVPLEHRHRRASLPARLFTYVQALRLPGWLDYGLLLVPQEERRNQFSFQVATGAGFKRFGSCWTPLVWRRTAGAATGREIFSSAGSSSR